MQPCEAGHRYLARRLAPRWTKTRCRGNRGPTRRDGGGGRGSRNVLSNGWQLADESACWGFRFDLLGVSERSDLVGEPANMFLGEQSSEGLDVRRFVHVANRQADVQIVPP